MAFTYTGGAANTGTSTSASVTHGVTINSGDLVLMYVNRNDATAIDVPTGGAAFTEALQETPSGETSRHGLFWKIAGASEPASYSAGLTSSSAWQSHVRVYSSVADAVVDSPAISGIAPGTSDLIAYATDGRVISDNALSLVFAGKDQQVSINYTGADNGHGDALGSGTGRQTGSCHRIYTTGETFSGNLTFTDDGAPTTDVTYSIHMSFVEASGDVTAPVITSPTTSNIGSTTADASVTTDEGNGDLYYYVSSNSSETAATIKASGSSQQVSASGVQNVSFVGLSASTSYYVHFVQDDVALNESNVVSTAQFTTLSPSFAIDSAPTTYREGEQFSITVSNPATVPTINNTIIEFI